MFKVIFKQNSKGTFNNSYAILLLCKTNLA